MATLPVLTVQRTLFNSAAYAPFEAVLEESDALSAHDAVTAWQAVRAFLWDALTDTASPEVLAEFDRLGLGETAILLTDLERGSLKFKGLILWVLAAAATPVIGEAVKESGSGQLAIEQLAAAIDAGVSTSVATGRDIYRDLSPALEKHARLAREYYGFQITRCDLLSSGPRLEVRRFVRFDRSEGRSFEL